MGFTANIVAFASMWFVFVDASSSLQNCEFEPGSIRRINSYVFQVKEDADYRLSGINLYRTTVAEVIARFGNPTNVTRVAKIMKQPGSGDYEWKRHGLLMHLHTCDDGRGREMLCLIEVRGTKPERELGITGRGLKLGSTMADVRRIYFPRLSTKPDDDKSEITLGWGYSVMDVHFDAGHVDHITLRRGPCPNIFGCTIEF